MTRLAAAPPTSSIRRHVARMLAVPAVAVLALLTVVGVGQYQGYSAATATSSAVNLRLALGELVHELQSERGLTAGVLGGNPSFNGELRTTRKRVDAQNARLTSLLAQGQANLRVSQAQRQLSTLDTLRRDTDRSTLSRPAAMAAYTRLITGLISSDHTLAALADPQLNASAASLSALEDLSEAISYERAILNGVFSASGFRSGEFVEFASVQAASVSAQRRFNAVADPTARAALRATLDTGAARTARHFEQVALLAADGRRITVNPQTWWSSQTSVLDDLQGVQRYLGATTQNQASAVAYAATLKLLILALITLIVLGVSIYLAREASASITTPLAAIAAEADLVARERLPQAVEAVRAESRQEPPPPVQVTARATREIRALADSLDRMQAAAFSLATEQAAARARTVESLANLGRRNQNLIRRQLGFITMLEREEIDPTALANLFELDHLATRMRRNASSLLVLVGHSSPRRWAHPVPIADALRAAISEVEEYRRVKLRQLEDVRLAGLAVGSISHLLAELVENALMFSPPDSEVEVQGRRLGPDYMLAIIDQGVGMSAADLATANARLSGQEDFLAAPTRFLGHFVVGRIASEYGIRVELLPSPVSGVTARILIPSALLDIPMAVQPPAPEAPALLAPAPDTPSAEATAQEAPALEAPTREAPTPVAPLAPSTPSAEATEPTEPVHPAPVLIPADLLAPVPAGLAPESGSGTAMAPVATISTTRNGLPLRTRETARAPRAHAADPQRVIDLDAASRRVDSSPEHVRSRLTALRSGVSRAAGDRAAAPTKPVTIREGSQSE